MTLPPIHDISTDIGDAPPFVTLLAWRQGAPNPASYDGPVVITKTAQRVRVNVIVKFSEA